MSQGNVHWSFQHNEGIEGRQSLHQVSAEASPLENPINYELDVLLAVLNEVSLHRFCSGQYGGPFSLLPEMESLSPRPACRSHLAGHLETNQVYVLGKESSFTRLETKEKKPGIS